MVETAKPEWVKMKPAELEKIALQLAKEGKTPAQIGVILRDQHGVPKAKAIGKRITKILAAANAPIIDEGTIIKKRIESLNNHLAKNKHDYIAKRSLQKKLWIVNKLQ